MPKYIVEYSWTEIKRGYAIISAKNKQELLEKAEKYRKEQVQEISPQESTITQAQIMDMEKIQ